VDDQVFLRSYRRVFRIERRLYRIEDWRLPLPGGVPLRALAYFCVAELCILILAQLPGTGHLLSLLPVEWRYGIVPIGCAMAGWWASPDGRPAHRFAATWLRAQLRRRRRRTGRPVRPEGERLELASDLAVRSSAPGRRLVRARVRGPARLVLSEPLALRSRRSLRGRRLELRPPSAQGEIVGRLALEDGETLEMRPA
jgi:hypothetical protein